MNSKLFLVIPIILCIIYSCDSNDASVETPADPTKEKTIEPSIDTLTPTTEPVLEINLNREQMRLYGVSTAQVGTRLTDLMFGDDSLTLEQAFDSNIDYQDQNGQRRSIPIRSILKNP